MARLVEVEGDLKHMTEEAYLISDGDKSVWIPKSQVTEEKHNFGNNIITLEIPEWLALEKGLI